MAVAAGPVAAQVGGQERLVLSLSNLVDSNRTEDFEAWVAAFRKAVEQMPAEAMSDAERCAFAGFSVIAGAPEGQSTPYYFVFDPFLPEVNYALRDILTAAIGREQAGAAMGAYDDMVAAQELHIQGRRIGPGPALPEPCQR
ncbi:hypothetical protein [Roseisalinus antarcticus]|uniref:Uncharacterized protein n=1 Tax=Roseisalinus antarcticus TaxID=254357 RepID=A0A1Y5RY88_9RHOB|nr:hypothetical protein [Roseisalinus antarcticus]SLN28350.1 hypothetical protein ROA7023_00955 [Roseisalinus antarcticus]